MKGFRGGVVFCLGLSFAPFAYSSVEHLGVYGNVYPIKEQNAIDAIKDKIALMQQNGQMDKLKKEWTDKALSRIENGPDPVAGVGRASKDTIRYFEPTIQVTKTITDDAGTVIAPEGTKVNPLDYTRLTREYIFIDGTDDKQVSWAGKYSLQKGGDLHARIILINGSPTKISRKLGQRIFFDQDGRIVKRLGIKAVPSIVKGKDNRVEIKELARY